MKSKSVTDTWSNLSKVVYRRTYSRIENGANESWEQTVDRVIGGNTRGFEVSQKEKDRLRYFMINRKAMPAGRGLWYSGSKSHEKLSGIALNNCWFLSCDDYENFVVAFDLLMLGGGVGMSVESRFVSNLPRIKRGVEISHRKTADAGFIVPDSREGWCEVLRQVLTSFFVTGKSFTYSTILIRGKGESISGFGGTSSGPLPLIDSITKITNILKAREGKAVRPIDALDVLCCIGECVVSGNVRRSAIIALGDPWDKDYLKAKRWDLGQLPTQRAMANLSVVCEDVDDLHPLFWETYLHGEPFGIMNRSVAQKHGRIGEKKHDVCIGLNPCGEAVLASGEPCNLTEIFLPNLKDEAEFEEAARLMFRYSKRVTCERYHHDFIDANVKKHRRVGVGITGCLQSALFDEKVLDKVYKAIQEEDKVYSRELGVPESIRTTVVKPSGTLSLLGETTAGIHPSFSEYYIRRVRFASDDPLVSCLREAGHHVEHVVRFDGTNDPNTVVAEFYCKTPEGTPTADRDWDTWKQLEVLKKVMRHWADQSASVTVYYKKEEIPKIREWLRDNLKELKSISFLCHNDHGFKQAPIEAIHRQKYEEEIKRIKPLKWGSEFVVDTVDMGLECEGGACPLK